MSIKLNMKTQSMIRQLGRRGSLLQVVAADTVNESAQDLKKKYVRRLERKQRLRARRFTLGAIKINESRPIRRSGEPRALGKINSIVGVRKLKGGKDHYLKDLELGTINRGNSRTQGKVPVPLTMGRTSQNINKPIAASNRLTKGDTQTLRAGGVLFGVKGDRHSSGRAWKNPRQRFAALYKYKRSGGGTGNLVGNLSKPFFFIDNANRLGIFKFFRGRVKKIRTLEQTTTKTPRSPNFKDSVNDLKPGFIQKKFIRKAERAIR